MSSPLERPAASNGSAVFDLRAVQKKYGTNLALDRVDLTIPNATTTVLLGPSGCGKSTLLRLLIGLVRPDDGEVLFEGAPLDPVSLPQLRLRMGYVIQEGGLFPHLSAGDNVTLLARHLGWPEPQIKARVAELSELSRLPDGALDRFPLELSGGQRQRVSLIRALMLDPRVLLLDEPLGALDPMIRAELQDDLRAIFRSLRKTVVLVTHDLAEAGFFGDRVVLMRTGRIVQQGTFDELIDTPRDDFVSAFVRAQRARVVAREA